MYYHGDLLVLLGRDQDAIEFSTSDEKILRG